ncbi:acetylxylan esterase [Phocaeicola salanitronis]|uniref:acetylxylan esterase n=1 Tax=Phocaeicola salanitronis TaxID=376805 RepID=UPI0025A378A8|nr:acetylxylan esterase [Phocaeicola salanitronis]MDM8306743.1 acetylxylan esterase [Phocaeicola salanitronis]
MKCLLKQVWISLFLLAAMPLWAENYPYRSDVLWVTVPDHADWLYETGEKAKVEVQFYKYGIPQDGLEVAYEIGGDMMPADKSGTVTLKNGRAVISMGTMNQPGFLDCRLSATVNGKKYKHHVKIGFSPEKLQPYTKLPADFNAFWEKNLAEAAKCPMKYTIEPAPEYSSEKSDCYLIKLQCFRPGSYIYGYLTRPKAAGNYPVVLCPPGAGVKTIKDPKRHIYYADEGCIRLEMEIHGLNPTMSAEEFKEISSAFGNYLVNGIDNRDNYYMKKVYLACVRAVDYLTSLPDWDGKNVIVQGGSQGGALALVTAGLDKRVTACVANHPALSDMAGYKAGRAGGYPHLFKNYQGMDTPEKINTLAYYDVVNFAKQIKVPVYMTWGYNDNTCPPTTSYIVYNVLDCPKEALITPINEHWTSEATEYGHLKWIQKHLK